MLAQRVSLFNVRDCEAFVRANLPRVILTHDSRDELIAEGLRILFDMGRAYKPGRNGKDPLTSSFSAYAKAYLPGKLRDAWHRQEGHTLTTLPDGSREWRYPLKGASLDGISEKEGGVDVIRLHDGTRMQAEDRHEDDPLEQIRRALGELSRIENEQTVRIALLLTEGFTVEQIGMELRMGGEEVTAGVDRLSQCVPYLRSQEAA